MSVSFEPKIYAFKADGAVAKGKAVKAGSDSKHVAVASAVSDKLIGLAQNDVTTAEDLIEVAVPGGGAKGLAGGNISFGDFLTVNGNGKLVASSTANDHIIGQAMEDAVDGDIFSVNVIAGNY